MMLVIFVVRYVIVRMGCVCILRFVSNVMLLSVIGSVVC